MASPHPSKAHDYEWDEGNRTELADHGIIDSDVLWVHENKPRFERNKIGAAGTWFMIGRDKGGRTLKISIMWADESTRTLRAITGWPI